MTMIALLGDLDDTAQTTAAITSVNEVGVTYMGIPVAVVGGAIATEVHTHDGTSISATPFGGSSTVTIAGRPVHRKGDSRSCREHFTVTKIPGEVRTVNIFT